MFKGFNLEVITTKNETFWEYHSIGKNSFDLDSIAVQSTLKAFIQKDNSLDGSAIQKVWFPSIKADVFISHSHKNVDVALAITGMLKKNLGLKVFVDSCVWGYGDDLLKMIDDKYCYIPSQNTYSYKLRNHSTSHVHMMFSTALLMMIDKTECLFFLNTPDSIKSYDETDKTESPWIYSEIAATQVLRQRTPDRLLRVTETFSNADGLGDLEKGFRMTHDIDISHLADLTLEELNLWAKGKRRDQHPLDTLYAIKSVS